MSDTYEYPPGCLLVVATPIGNLGDISPRACAALALADLIAAEDTRHSGVLLERLAIHRPLQSLHEHNEAEVVPALIARMQNGERIALISDAGTPLISDPGYALVRDARIAGLEIRTLPGPCAAIAALSVAGLPSDRFVFEGFLPNKSAARKQRLAELADESRSLVLYESSHRIAATIADVSQVLGASRRLCLARELTKLHEQSITLPAGELCDWLAADANRRRGEFVLVLAGADEKTDSARHEISLDALIGELLAAMPMAQAARAAARLTGAPRNHVYQRALDLSAGL